MRQVALSGHEGDHNLVGTPTAADDGIAEQAQMLVLVKGGNVQALSFTRDAVKNLAGPRRLDRAFRNSNDSVCPTFKKAAADSALFAGSKRSGSLMTKTTRRRIFARVSQGDSHTANRIDSNALTLAKRGKKLLHGSLLGCQLLLIRTIERRAPTASFHDRTGRLGVHSLTRRLSRILARAFGTNARRLIPALTRARTLGLNLTLRRLTLRILRRLGFLGRFFLLRPLSRLNQSTTSPTLRTRFCHELTPLLNKRKVRSNCTVHSTCPIGGDAYLRSRARCLPECRQPSRYLICREFRTNRRPLNVASVVSRTVEQQIKYRDGCRHSGCSNLVLHARFPSCAGL